MRIRRPLILAALFVAASTRPAVAQSLIVYDDSLKNGFANWSYGGGSDFFNTQPEHDASVYSIAFTGNSNNAVSFTHETGLLSTANYPILHFWIHGGANGNQALTLILQKNCSAPGNPCAAVATANLNAFIAGGSPGAGVWREVTVPITLAPLSYTGNYDRIDIASSTVQGTVYFDTVTLTASVIDPIFKNGFEGSTPAPNGLVEEHDVTVASMVSDRFSWRDSANKPRVAVLAHNDGQNGPVAPDGGYPNRGGALREFRYQMPDNSTRVAGVTNYGNGGQGGFGYVVSHSAWPSNGGGCNGDDSPLGYGTPGAFQRVFEGRHHAIFRFTQNYPRHCSAAPGGATNSVPVTIDWTFSTGRDNPLWSITYDMSALPANYLFDDSRAPYGELNIDGAGSTDISGVGWGDRWQFTSTSAPVMLDSAWTWNTQNTVPYVKLWITSTNATMGIVQSQTMTQQDAGARNEFYHDVSAYWNHTSAQGNAGGTYAMPWQDSWPYQANSYSIDVGASNNNARLTWGTSYGFLGQTNYSVHDGVVANAPGYPKKSYAVYVVLGPQTTLPVEAQRSQVETIQTLALTASVGSVATSGPAGPARADTITYAPSGYNPVYGALTFLAAGNTLDANISVGAGHTLKHPMLVIRGMGAYPTTVKLNGATLTADTDYFPSLWASANELWLTVNRDLTGATNRVQLQP